MRPRLISCAVLVAGVLPVAGCSDAESPVATGPLRPSAQMQTSDFPRAGMKLKLPANMQVNRQVRPPAVLRANLAEAFVSAYAYRRAEQLPRNARELRDARRRLVRTTRGRDAGYRLKRSRTTEIDGARAIELVGEQTLGRTRLRIRSLHVYRGVAEYVIEVGSPRRGFARFDRSVTPLIERTLNVTGRIRRG